MRRGENLGLIFGNVADLAAGGKSLAGVYVQRINAPL
jgi:hypothetical protein